MKIEIDYNLLQDLVLAAQNVALFYGSLVRGETKDIHPDWDSVEYLLRESESAASRGRDLLDLARVFPNPECPDDDLPF